MTNNQVSGRQSEEVEWRPAPPPGMSRMEAYRIAQMLVQAWPEARLDEATIQDLWVPRLVKCDFAVAQRALDQLIDQPRQFMPKWGEFREVYLAAAKRRNEEQAEQQRALPHAPARPEVAAMWRDKIRDQLGEAKGPLVNHLAAKLRLPPDVRRPDSDYFEDGPDAVETSATDNASQP